MNRWAGWSQFVADVRVIVATNKSLDALVKEGNFAKTFLPCACGADGTAVRCANAGRICRCWWIILWRGSTGSRGRDIAGVSDAALARLMEYDFPGNVRELENIIEHAFVLCRAD